MKAKYLASFTFLMGILLMVAALIASLTGTVSPTIIMSGILAGFVFLTFGMVLAAILYMKDISKNSQKGTANPQAQTFVDILIGLLTFFP